MVKRNFVKCGHCKLQNQRYHQINTFRKRYIHSIQYQWFTINAHRNDCKKWCRSLDNNQQENQFWVKKEALDAKISQLCFHQVVLNFNNILFICLTWFASRVCVPRFFLHDECIGWCKRCQPRRSFTGKCRVNETKYFEWYSGRSITPPPPTQDPKETRESNKEKPHRMANRVENDVLTKHYQQPWGLILTTTHQY